MNPFEAWDGTNSPLGVRKAGTEGWRREEVKAEGGRGEALNYLRIKRNLLYSPLTHQLKHCRREGGRGNM